jgi:threonine-phosphate decarboxylase
MGNLAFEHGGNIYQAQRQYKRKFLDFSANINPLGLTRTLKNKLYESYNKIIFYPDPETKVLKRQIAKYWHISQDNILIGNGSSELIYLIVHTFMPERVLIPAPTFCEYERASQSIKTSRKIWI